jgi:peptidoglycan/LPS O-acetylase OafA/YrhL
MSPHSARPRSLDAALAGEENSFNAVRLLAAAAVVVSHSFALLRGELVGEPLYGLTPYTLGQHAVTVFFALSGLMLARSWDRNPDILRFARARLLRIYPALIACGLVTALLVGALATRLPLAEYLSSRETLSYPVLVGALFNGARLPEVFATGPQPGAVNYSLWTIKYELAAYVAFGVAAVLGLAGRRLLILFAVTALVGAVYVLERVEPVGKLAPAVPMGRFFLAFTLGAAAYYWRERLPLRLDLLAAATLAAFAMQALVSDLAEAAFVALASYGALVFGSLRARGPAALAGRHDVSYGLYLYGWPVQQLILPYAEWHPLAHAAAATAIALVLATLSWFLVEKPALALKRRRPAAMPLPAGAWQRVR